MKSGYHNTQQFKTLIADDHVIFAEAGHGFGDARSASLSSVINRLALIVRRFEQDFASLHSNTSEGPIVTMMRLSGLFGLGMS